jgi:hypothetical protein
MSLPAHLQKIKEAIEKRKKTKNLSQSETVLLSELVELDRRVSTQVLNEVKANVTRMTGPGDNVCGECGRPY